MPGSPNAASRTPEAAMSALLQSLTAAAEIRLTQAREPAWLRDARTAALASVRADGLPTPRIEAWKYTAIRALEARTFVPVDELKRLDVDAALLPGAAARLVFVNGVLRADLSRLDTLPAGVTLAPLSAALGGGDIALRFFLARRFDDRGDAFARLNTALAAEGAVLRVANGVKVVEPIEIVSIGAPVGTDVAWQLRHLIELGEDSALVLVERHLATAPHANLGNVFVQLRLRAGASLRLVQLQDESGTASLIRRSELELDADACAELTTLELGAAFARHDLVARLGGDRARIVSRGCFALSGRQHGDTHINVRHAARRTGCDLLWRGIADGRARGVFHGAIRIDSGADGADARLSNKNLLLSPQAEIDTQPVLEIHADEVQASHGATVGQLDAHALFYLRSRGVPQSEARALLTYAFCRETLDAVPLPALRESLGELLLRRLPIGAVA